MPISACSALLVTLVVWGPPKLPPLPGERPPPAETEPDAPAPSKPTPAPSKPTPAPNKPTPTPAPPPSTVPPGATAAPPPGPATPPPSEIRGPTAGPIPRPGAPGEPEPTQPTARGPVPEPEPPPADAETSEPAETRPEDRPRRRKRAPGEAPRMDEGLLPGGEDDEPRRLVLPPPQRPPFNGLGMFIGAGVTFTAALSEQIVAHVLVKRRCIDPIASLPEPAADETEADTYADALLQCAPGVLPAVVLRVHSDLGLLATIGLASAGAAMRAHQTAYDDVFADRPPKTMMGLRAAGISLIGTGVVTWLTTGAVSWGVLAGCRTAKCATRARLMAFTTRDTAAVLVAAGAGMLGYAMSHRRAYDRFYRDRALSIGAAWLPGGGGLSLTGRF